MILEDGTNRHYYGCLVTFFGDTPVSSLAGGFKEGVGGAYRCCSTCIIISDDLSTSVSYFYSVMYSGFHILLFSLMKQHCD